MRRSRVREEEIGIIGTEAITSKAVSSSGWHSDKASAPT